jgi:hypothetical protein
VHAGDRRHSRQAPAGPHDHLSVDLFAQDAVGRSDVACALWSDRGCLQAQSRHEHRLGGLRDDLVAGRASMTQREIEALELEVDAQQLRIEQAHRLLEQLLSGLIALHHHDPDRVGHVGGP